MNRPPSRYDAASASEAGDLLIAVGLCKDFGRGSVLNHVDFSIAAGERVAIVGPSGSGKTTLLRCLNLLVTPDAGRITYRGELVGAWDDRDSSGMRIDVSRYRSRIGMVFQGFELFPHLTARSNITLGPRRVLGVPKETAEARADDLLAKIGLAAIAHARPRTLSGGQQQRVAIARALAMDPELVLFDEPTSALDGEMVSEVLDLISTLAREGTTMVIVTHELLFAKNVADRLVVMDQGTIIGQGPPAELFSDPSNPRVAAILKSRLG